MIPHLDVTIITTVTGFTICSGFTIYSGFQLVSNLEQYRTVVMEATSVTFCGVLL